MERNKILEGNLLIAGMMGVPVVEFYGKNNEILGLAVTDKESGSIDWPNGIDWYDPDSNWNLLMPAWKKFKDMTNEIYSELSHFNTKFLLGCSNNDISKSWQALVEGMKILNKK